MAVNTKHAVLDNQYCITSKSQLAIIVMSLAEKDHYIDQLEQANVNFQQLQSESQQANKTTTILQAKLENKGTNLLANFEPSPAQTKSKIPSES